MTIGLLGKKLGMTQLFQPDGTVIPVTVVQAGPCKVLQVKAKELSELAEEDRQAANNRGKKTGRIERSRHADGYYAVQVGFDEKPVKQASKAEIGHAAKSGSQPMRMVREFRLADAAALDAATVGGEAGVLKAGADLTVSIFGEGEKVDVTGTTKGRGWSGTIKRYGFAKQRTTHGNSKAHRKLGGLGRVYSTMKGLSKGKKMPGHYGVDRQTVQNLRIVKTDEERNLLYLRGAVPGHRNGYVVVRKAVKQKNAKQS